MNASSTLKNAAAILAAAAAASLPGAAFAQAQSTWDAGKWRYGLELYAYLPTIGGAVDFPVGSSSAGNINVDADTLIDNLQFTIMGMFEAHNGRWGVYTDLMYLNVDGSESKTRDFTVGGGAVPGSVTGDLKLDLKGTIWTIAGEYRLVSGPAWNVDLLGGARMFSVKPKLEWSLSSSVPELPGTNGSKEVKETNWDAVVGLKGRYAFGANRDWYVPFYVDVGTGQSDLTWQIAAGIGYNYRAWTFNALWRYLDYNFKSGDSIEDMNFNGPMLGVGYRW